MISIFLIATVISLAFNMRHAFQKPSESEVQRLVNADLRYRSSIRGLFGSMCIGLGFMAVAAFFAFTGSTGDDKTVALILLIYYPIYYWVTALGYSEILGIVAQKHYGIEDPMLRPKLFAVTRDRAQRVHAITAMVLSLLLISNAGVAGAWTSALNMLVIVGWVAWVPINFSYFKASAMAMELLYPSIPAPGPKATAVAAGFAFHMATSMMAPILIFAAPFLLPKILRRDQEMVAE